MAASASSAEKGTMENVLFVEVGFGADQHGQDATKAAVRACRNAIEFNSIPSIKRIVPGGYDAMKLKVQLAVPAKYGKGLDLEAVKKVFPYGKMLPIEVRQSTRRVDCGIGLDWSLRPIASGYTYQFYQVQHGGMVASSGIAIKEMGDSNEDMVIVVAAVTVGH